MSMPAGATVSPVPAPTLPNFVANTAWNVAGQVVPIVVGIVALPLLIRVMGLDRYGFLTLVWVLVGYASIFDFGIGRVLIRIVASRIAQGNMHGANHLGWSSSRTEWTRPAATWLAPPRAPGAPAV